jgi:hypothetical protein
MVICLKVNPNMERLVIINLLHNRMRSETSVISPGLFVCSLEEMRRHGELWRLFVHAMPLKFSDTPSAALTKVRVQEVVPVIAVLAASLVLAGVFLVSERCLHKVMHQHSYQHQHRQHSLNSPGFNSSQ